MSNYFRLNERFSAESKSVISTRIQRKSEMFSCFNNLGLDYCYQCMHGPEGCMVPSRQGDGGELYAHSEELEAKLRGLAKKESLEIEKLLENDKKTYGSHIKILILGGPSSGKSTIFKQMQIIHANGFKTEQELIQYRGLIDTNIRQMYRQLISGARVVGISLEPLESLVHNINKVYAPMDADEFSIRTIPDVVEPLTAFWNSREIQEVYKRRYEFELLDSTKYYLDNLDRISKSDYLPNEEDIVHSRKATVTINSIVFQYTGVSLLMVDVGGQRSERKKWLHLFDDAKVVIFVIDLTGYAKKSEESRTELSRFPNFFKEIGNDAFDMKVALKIFNDVAGSHALANAVFLLFFNKVDLFKELLPQVSLQPCFSKFAEENSYDNTSKFICDKFIRAAKPKKSVFPHFTTATNTENIKMVFRACMESVFKANSKATGLS